LSIPAGHATYNLYMPVTIYHTGGPGDLPPYLQAVASSGGLSQGVPLEPSAEIKIKPIRSLLSVGKPQMIMMISEFMEEMNKGLALHAADPSAHWDEKKCCFKMLETHIDHIPTGSEKGVYYAVDVGGTNFRVVRIELLGDGKIGKTSRIKRDLKQLPPAPEKPKGLLDASVKQSEFFGYLADQVIQVGKHEGDIAGEGLEGEASPVLGFGFTFSFPTQQDQKNHAILSHWTKEWDTGRDYTGTDECIEGRDVGQMFDDAFAKKGGHAKVHGVINDTVGTLLSCSYENPHLPPVYMGLILGTGSNGCYYEPKYKQYSYNGKLINIEFGNFNRSLPETDIDKQVDADLSNKADVGRQRFEKMVSGKYLGEISRRFVCSIMADKLKGTKAELIDSLKSEHASKIVQDESQNLEITCLTLFEQWGVTFSLNELRAIQEICRLVFDRSASLAAMSIVAVALKADRIGRNAEGMTVAIDGSLYTQNPWYQHRLKQHIVDIVGREDAQKVHLQIADDGSGKGAAVMVAADQQA